MLGHKPVPMPICAPQIARLDGGDQPVEPSLVTLQNIFWNTE